MPRSSPGSSEGAGLAAVAALRARVLSTSACDAIPGCPIKIDKFLPRMWSAVAKGFIPQAEGEQLQEGLLRGFKLGVDPNLMAGHRWPLRRRCFLVRLRTSWSGARPATTLAPASTRPPI